VERFLKRSLQNLIYFLFVIKNLSLKKNIHLFLNNLFITANVEQVCLVLQLLSRHKLVGWLYNWALDEASETQ